MDPAKNLPGSVPTPIAQNYLNLPQQQQHYLNAFPAQQQPQMLPPPTNFMQPQLGADGLYYIPGLPPMLLVPAYSQQQTPIKWYMLCLALFGIIFVSLWWFRPSWFVDDEEAPLLMMMLITAALIALAVFLAPFIYRMLRTSQLPDRGHNAGF